MPRIRRTSRRKSQSKRRYGRKTTKRTKKSSGIVDLSRHGFTFPNTMLAKFNYTDAKTYTPATGGATNNKYRLDSLYDPDATGVGTKVAYYDDLISSPLYRFYRVYGAKVKIALVNESAVPCSVQIGYNTEAVIPNMLATSPSNVDIHTSNPREWIVNLGSVDGGRNIYNKTFYVKNYGVVGRTKQQYLSGQQYREAYNGSIYPAASDRVQLLCNVIGGVAGGTSTQPTVAVQVKITYYAKLVDFGAYQTQT